MPRELSQRTRLLVIDPKPFKLQAKTLGVSGMVEFLKGRSDIPRFLLGADLLIHPAYNENTGTVLLEALVAGLPVLVTDVCGYAHYITDANCGRVVPSPFEQQALDQMLAQMLADDAQRSAWSRNALAFAETADLYSMPQKAADVILGKAHERRVSPAGAVIGGSMRLMLTEPFESLWQGKDPFEEVERLQGRSTGNWKVAARCVPRLPGAVTLSRSIAASAGARSSRTCSRPRHPCLVLVRNGERSSGCTKWVCRP